MGEASLPIGEKVHFAMTQSVDKQTIYINGVKVAEEEGNIPYENAKFVIGKGCITRFFHGKMDYVRAWNVARTEQQIMEYKDIEIHEAQEGLIGSWNFNEGSGNKVYDESGNGHHGTVYGATWELSN